MNYRLFIPLAGVVAAPFPAQSVAAQDLANSSIIVTSARVAQESDETGQAITVIEREEIARRQTVQLADLLASTPGISIARNGGAGGVTSLFVRGADSDQVLVLVDGVRVSDPASPAEAYDFGHLMASQIERVEILRGSNSVAWGSRAIGGVINITTRAPSGEFSAEAVGEYGYSGTVNTGLTITAPVGEARLSVNGSYFESDAISQFDGGTERDAYRNSSFNARLDVPLDDRFTLDLRGTYIDGRTDIDGFPPPSFSFGDTAEFQKTKQWIGYAGLRADLGAVLGQISASRNEVDRATRDPSSAFPETSDNEGISTRFEYRGSWEAAQQVRFSFGFEHEDTEFNSLSFGVADEAKVDTDSLYLLAILEPVDALTLTTGVRYDDHSLFGSETSLGANAAYRLGDNFVLRASYGEGFKAPSPYQLFSSDFGNPALRPTRSKNYEAGATFILPGNIGDLSATWYRRDSSDLIDFVSCFGSTDPRCASYTFGFYDNVQRARAQGVEVEAVLRPTQSLTVSANYTHTDAENRSRTSANFGNQLARRPRDEAAASIDWDTPIGLSVGSTVRIVGSSFNDAGNFTALSSYTLVDARASYPVTEKVEVFGRVENLFDENYQTVAGYGTYPLSAYVGIRVRLGE